MVVLATDLLGLLERDAPEGAALRRRLRTVEAGTVVTTIITFEEQMRGWLAIIASARTMARQIQAYAIRARGSLDSFRESGTSDVLADASV